MDGTPNAPALAPAAYLDERVDDQIRWYDAKSVSHKRWYCGLQLLTLIAAALVPVISLSSGEFAVRVVVAVSGSIAAIAAGAVSLYRFREQWVDYRVVAETLKAERYRFLTATPPYADGDAFARFVERIESIIAGENRRWRQKDFGPDEAGDEAVSRTGNDAPSVDADAVDASDAFDGAPAEAGGTREGEEAARAATRGEAARDVPASPFVRRAEEAGA